MLYAVLCEDKPDSLDLRMKVRPVHLEYLNGLGAKMKLAGPFLNDAGDSCGTLLVIEAETRSEAEAMAAADPYAKAGLFASTEVKAWRWTLKNPEA